MLRDLAQADDAYLQMDNALYQRDPVALRAGLTASQDAWVAIADDLQS